MDFWTNWIAANWLVVALVPAGIGVLAYSARHPRVPEGRRAAAAQKAGPDSAAPIGLYLVEQFQPARGAGFFALILIGYNVVMPIWMFTGTGGAQQIVVALMWIGGNQALGFIVKSMRTTVYEVRRRAVEAGNESD